MKRFHWILCAWVSCCGVLFAQDAASPTRAADAPVRYVEREFRMPYTPAGINGLDVLEVRADLPGKHPLALLTHGTAADQETRAHVTPWGQQEQALWFARRGYVALVVVRQGYGRSGGRQDSVGGGCGISGSFRESGDASADDLRAAAKYMASQPEVDASQIVSVGVSTGGFAQVALAANPPPGLKAAISFAGGRGGDGKGNNCNLGGLISTFRDLGKHAKVPMLWIYAENDKWFTPKMSVEFEKAYHQAGGQDEFEMVPPDGEDGHGYYRHVSAWSDRVEGFLREKDLLPLADVLPPPRVAPQPAPVGLSDHGIEAFERFLAGGPYKAFATNGGTFYGYSTGQFDQEIADKNALEGCAKATKGVGKCTVVSNGSRPPGGK